MENKLRIIGGEWRSRQVHFVDVPGLRPTPARVRETLFNWLQYDLIGSNCLDLYAGSGALGFEAASRGAKTVVLVENNPIACRALKDNTVKLAAGQIKIQCMDVLRHLSGDGQRYDIVFMDPPFAQGLAVTTCNWLEDKNWLSPQAKIYVETERMLDFEAMPKNWQLLKNKVAGDVAYRLYSRIA